MSTKTFMELLVWQKSHQFVLMVYDYTSTFPKSETYGLVSQFRRAAVSIPANIAEGYKKVGKLDKARFYNIAQGSLSECDYYIILTRDLKFGLNDHLKVALDEVSKMLESYRSKILSAK
jgi:four helix bundle protein